MTSVVAIMAHSGNVMNIISATELPDEQETHPLQNMIRKVRKDV